MLLLRTARWLSVFGGLALLLAAVRPAALRSHPWRSAGSSDWSTGDFVPGAVYPTTTSDRLPARLRTIGSWLGDGRRPASAQTVWFNSSARSATIFVAGYPQAPGCSLRAEFRDAAGHVTAVDFNPPNPAEAWTAWTVPLPSRTVSLRFTATGGTAGQPYWLGFSEPVSLPSPLLVASYQAAQILTTFALGWVLLWLPGVLAHRRATAPELQAALLIGAGPLVLAFVSLAAWSLGRWIPPVVSGEFAAGLIWAGLGAGLWLKPLAFELGAATERVLAIAALCALAAVAKAAYSGGPEGELFRGETRRTLAVGNRADAETSYRVVQVVARDLRPLSAETATYFAPWSFFSRGPLAGFAAGPVIFATGKPPLGPMNSAWQPFDPWGYTSYRIVMALLASGAIVALFLVLAEFVDGMSASLGAAALALCPFVLHEVMFTWPKLAATAGLLVSFLLAHRGRPILSGAVLAISYLFHPLALLWTPWLGLWVLARGPRVVPALLRRGAGFALPLAAVVGPWMVAGEFARRAAGTFYAAQSSFLSYFVWAEGFPAPLKTWLHSRWMNLANTFLPLWLHCFNESHADLNSIYGPAGPLVKFAFSWWNTLPLGMGLLFWALAMTALWRAWRTLAPAITLFILGPAALLCLYWGDKSTGLMRECGHPLIPAIIAVSVIWFARSPTRPARLFFHRAFPWLQLPEVLLMGWLTTLANPHPPVSDLSVLDPLWFGLNLAALGAIAALAAQARSGQLRCLARAR